MRRAVETAGDLTPNAVNDLAAGFQAAAIDVLVSPSRAEGYGLTLVEAAQAGVPAVSSRWRLSQDILDMPLVHSVGYDLMPVSDAQGIYAGIPGARWANPRLDEMADIVCELCARST